MRNIVLWFKKGWRCHGLSFACLVYQITGGDRWNGLGLQTGVVGVIAGKAEPPAIPAPKEGKRNTGGMRISLPVSTVTKSVTPLGAGVQRPPRRIPPPSSGPVFARNVLQKGLPHFTPKTELRLTSTETGVGPRSVIDKQPTLLKALKPFAGKLCDLPGVADFHQGRLLVESLPAAR